MRSGRSTGVDRMIQGDSCSAKWRRGSIGGGGRRRSSLGRGMEASSFDDLIFKNQ